MIRDLFTLAPSDVLAGLALVFTVSVLAAVALVLS